MVSDLWIWTSPFCWWWDRSLFPCDVGWLHGGGLAGLLLLLSSLSCFSTGFGGSGSQVDSARMNLASSFVNGFVNAAFGQDKLLTDDGNKWLYKNKDHGE